VSSISAVSGATSSDFLTISSDFFSSSSTSSLLCLVEAPSFLSY
jgi:hypothetical protein